MFNEHVLGEHIGSPLQRVMQWFKTMSTNEYIRNVKTNNWPRFDGKLWQRNYWEHIIRDEKSYSAISEYIINNPLKWNNDSINPGHQKI
jgi:REP element-mobilizing transposase RayT